MKLYTATLFRGELSNNATDVLCTVPANYVYVLRSLLTFNSDGAAHNVFYWTDTGTHYFHSLPALASLGQDLFLPGLVLEAGVELVALAAGPAVHCHASGFKLSLP